MLAQHICCMYSIKLTEVHFQLFLPPYKYYCYSTSFAVLFLRIHNLMVSLVPSSSFLSPASSLHSSTSTWVYLMMKISNNASFPISLFLLNKRSYAISSLLCVCVLRFPPGAQFCWFLFYSMFLISAFAKKRFQNKTETFSVVVKLFHTWKFSHELFMISLIVSGRKSIQEKCQRKRENKSETRAARRRTRHPIRKLAS